MKLASALFAFAVLLLSSCASGDYTIRIFNQTSEPLVPFPVVTTPPPPHREADPSNAVPPDGLGDIVPTGFNPMYYSPARNFSVLLQLGLDDDPPQILGRIFTHVVPPGQEGTDPALQPTLQAEELFEPTKLNLVFIVGAGSPVPLSMIEM